MARKGGEVTQAVIVEQTRLEKRTVRQVLRRLRRRDRVEATIIKRGQKAVRIYTEKK